jgi:hypothetical protein
MTPAIAEVTCIATSGMVPKGKGHPVRSSLFQAIHVNPGPLARCLDLARRPEDPMDATTEAGAV